MQNWREEEAISSAFAGRAESRVLGDKPACSAQQSAGTQLCSVPREELLSSEDQGLLLKEIRTPCLQLAMPSPSSPLSPPSQLAHMHTENGSGAPRASSATGKLKKRKHPIPEYQSCCLTFHHYPSDPEAALCASVFRSL